MMGGAYRILMEKGGVQVALVTLTCRCEGNITTNIK